MSTVSPVLAERTVEGLHDSLVSELSGLARRAAILDVGCGTGAWLARLKSRGFVDLSGVDLGEAPLLEGVAFRNVDLDREDLSFGQKRFDFITAIEVLEHVQNIGLVMGHLARALSAHGKLLVTTPNLHSLRARVRFMLSNRLPYFDEKSDPTHVSPIYLPLLQKVARPHGLFLEKAWTYPSKGTLVFSHGINALASVVRAAIADPLPGDTLCVLFVRDGRPEVKGGR